MSAYAEAAASVSGQERPTGSCASPGCCLPGTMTTSTTGTQDWWCSVHFQLPRSEHDAATALIANRKELWHIARQLINPPRKGSDHTALRATVKTLRPDLLKGHENCGYWHLGAHMISVLFRECRTPQACMGTPKRDSSGTSWLDASQPEEIEE